MVFWIHNDIHPQFKKFTDLRITLEFLESIRKIAVESQFTFITMSSENTDRVGKDGVDEVHNGKTPDGVAYAWDKSSRIGATRR